MNFFKAIAKIIRVENYGVNINVSPGVSYSRLSKKEKERLKNPQVGDRIVFAVEGQKGTFSGRCGAIGLYNLYCYLHGSGTAGINKKVGEQSDFVKLMYNTVNEVSQ